MEAGKGNLVRSAQVSYLSWSRWTGRFDDLWTDAYFPWLWRAEAPFGPWLTGWAAQLRDWAWQVLTEAEQVMPHQAGRGYRNGLGAARAFDNALYAPKHFPFLKEARYEHLPAPQWCQVNDRRIFLTFNEFGIYGSDSPVSSVTSPFDARRFTDGPKGSRGLGLDGPGVKGSYPIRRAHERGITGSSEKPAYGLLWQSLLKWSAKPISEERLSDVHQSPTHFSTDR